MEHLKLLPRNILSKTASKTRVSCVRRVSVSGCICPVGTMLLLCVCVCPQVHPPNECQTSALHLQVSGHNEKDLFSEIVGKYGGSQKRHVSCILINIFSFL